MYYFRWRRETGGHGSFWQYITNRNAPTQPYNPPHVNAGPGGYPAGHYNDPYGSNQPGQPGYYNPNYPNYPNI